MEPDLDGLPEEEAVIYRKEFAGGGPFIRIIADDGEGGQREIATCRGSGDAWPQAVEDAELIVQALNAYEETHDGLQ